MKFIMSIFIESKNVRQFFIAKSSNRLRFAQCVQQAIAYGSICFEAQNSYRNWSSHLQIK